MVITSRAAILAMVVILWSPSLLLHAAAPIVDTARGFTLTLPDGFAVQPGVVGVAPKIIHANILGDPTDDKLDIHIFIEGLHGTIGRERLKLSDMPPGFKGRLFTVNWQGFELDAFEVPERVGDIATVTYNVQIPLKRAAIQLKLFGPRDREADLQRLLPEILSGLQGESNWLASASPSAPITSSENYGTLLLVAAIAFVLIGLVVLYLISRKAPKGTVLAIAAAIYIASWGFSGPRVRETVVLSGSLRLLGCAGILLGLVDLARKRKGEKQRGKT